MSEGRQDKNPGEKYAHFYENVFEDGNNHKDFIDFEEKG